MNRARFTIAALAAIAVAAGISSGDAHAQSGEIPDEVVIGGVFDVTGNWSQEGEEGKSAAEQAVDDFNEYLATIGAGWRMSMQVEDAQANASVALEKVQSLKGRGIDLLVGMGFSSHIQTAKGYIDSNNMLAISHGSQAANLAIDDSIFRLRPDDNSQAPVINTMLEDAGIEVLATVTRGDPWGDGLKQGISDMFEGDIVDVFRYNPDAVDFSVEVSVLDDEIGRLVDRHGPDKVGVLYLGTNEFMLLIQQMSLYDNVDKVRWFSTNIQAGNPALVEDATAFEFAQKTQFIASRSVIDNNSIKTYLDGWGLERYGRIPSVYSYAAYDSVWLLGTAIQQAQSADVGTLTAVIPAVARNMIGSAGHLELNGAGDLAGGMFEIWQVTGSGWTKIAEYQDGAITGSGGAAAETAGAIMDDASIPGWVRISAGWWAEGLIDDQTFLQAIQFLIKEGILVIR